MIEKLRFIYALLFNV